MTPYGVSGPKSQSFTRWVTFDECIYMHLVDTYFDTETAQVIFHFNEGMLQYRISKRSENKYA